MQTPRTPKRSDAPFNYRLRESPRARNVCLRVTVERGLEVVVPAGFNPARVHGFIERKQNWIRAALERAERQRALLGVDLPWAPPSEITFPALGKTWQVVTTPSDTARVSLREHGAQLQLRGRLNDEALCQRTLWRWLLRQGSDHLAPGLQSLALELGFEFRRVAIRRQRSRWGSCSRNGTIALNAKLLFLPPPLVRYVMVHELCHLVHLNHAPRFWALVEKHHPGARADDRALRDGWKFVPRWAR